MDTHPLDDNRVFAGVLLVIGAVWAVGLPVDVIDTDAAEYAHLARQMLEGGSYLQIKNRAWEYLDKPPLHFWLSALSYAVFGVGVVAYKLPAFIFAWIGVLSAWGFARLFYDERVARVAAVMTASCQAIFMITSDVRTDTVLLGATTLAVWQLAEFERRPSTRAFLLMCLGVAGAMMTKGPIGVMVPALALFSDAALKREWRRLVRPAWLLAVLVVLLLLGPMVYGLWLQHGMKGVRFYFWTQSFGRITGESQWKDDTTPLFFTHTFLWSFLPWSFLAVLAWAMSMRALYTSKFRVDGKSEAYSLGAFTLAFIAFSLSRYKLPHYIFVVFPLAAVFTSSWLHRMAGVWPRFLLFTQLSSSGIALVLMAVFALWAFPMTSIALWLCVLALVAGGLLTLRSPSRITRLLGPPLGAILAFNLVLSAHVWPSMLQFQAPMVAARWILSSGIPKERVFALDGTLAYSMDFYLQKPMRELTPDNFPELLPSGPIWLFTTENGLEKIRAAGYDATVVQTWPHHAVSRLNGKFLNPATRESILQKRLLVRVPSTS